MTTDEKLMRQALNALEGVLEVAARKGVKPTDISLTIMASLRRRLDTPGQHAEQAEAAYQAHRAASDAPR